MKKLLILLPLLLAGCSGGEKAAYPEIESRAQVYLQAQTSGQWKTLCQKLAPSERANIERALGSSCLQALQKNKKLQRRLQSASIQIEGIEKENSNYLVRFQSGEIWVTPDGITFTKP